MRLKCQSMSVNQRRNVIRTNILKLTYTEIAKECGVTERTINRDIKTWRQEGGFEELLYDEFMKSYPDQKESSPEKTFDRLCFLLGKTFTQRKEVYKDVNITQTEEVNINVNNFTPEELQFAKQVARKYIQTTNTNGSPSLH